jgi:hypothetical protein
MAFWGLHHTTLHFMSTTIYSSSTGGFYMAQAEKVVKSFPLYDTVQRAILGRQTQVSNRVISARKR